MADKLLIDARKAGREAADNLSDLYITESKRLCDSHGEYGLEASITFLERLRDNLMAIRPIQEKIAPRPNPAVVERSSVPSHSATTYDDSDCPDGYVLIDFSDEVMAETDLAVMIGSQWVPKSMLDDVPERGEYVENLPVKSWFAEKEGLI